MPHWYSDKRDLHKTPSQVPPEIVGSHLDGGEGHLSSSNISPVSPSRRYKAISFEREMKYRREGVRFILELGKALGLSHQTMATASVYFHRFYLFQAFQQFPRFVVATCCLFLAGKAEETPKKCRDLIRTVRTLLNDSQFASFGHDPREEVMIVERVLLQTIKFDLQVDHPYSCIIKYAKCLKSVVSTAQNPVEAAKLEKMVQMSWTFVNDSLSTTLCLQYESEIVAIALMYLAGKLSKFEVKDWMGRRTGDTHWWDQYVENLETPVLEIICHQVLDLYAQPTVPTAQLPSTPVTSPLVSSTHTNSSSVQQHHHVSVGNRFLQSASSSTSSKSSDINQHHFPNR